MDTVSECHTEAPQAIVSEELAQGPYMAVGVGFEPVTLRTQSTELTTEPPHLTILLCILNLVMYSEFCCAQQVKQRFC